MKVNSRAVVEGLKPTVATTEVKDALAQIVNSLVTLDQPWTQQVVEETLESDAFGKVVRYKLPVTEFPRGRALYGVYKAVTDLYTGVAKNVKVDRGFAECTEVPYHYVTVTIKY